MKKYNKKKTFNIYITKTITMISLSNKSGGDIFLNLLLRDDDIPKISVVNLFLFHAYMFLINEHVFSKQY